MYAPISPSQTNELDWPTMDDVIKVQPNKPRSTGWRKIGKVFKNNHRQIFIPEREKRLKWRIVIAVHAGLAGHRGPIPTIKKLTGRFYWKNRDKDVRSFTSSCLHCLNAGSNSIVRRPIGHSVHADKPNEMIHFGYCYLRKSDDEETSVLIIKDDMTSYLWRKPVAVNDDHTTASILLDWFAAFGTAHTWLSDQRTHFLNETVKEVNQRLKVRHPFTSPYSPWSNGTVEIVYLELQRATKTLLHEF